METSEKYFYLAPEKQEMKVFFICQRRIPRPVKVKSNFKISEPTPSRST